MQRRIARPLSAAALLAAATLSPTGATAQGADRWEFGASLNGWFASIYGTANFPHNSTDLSIDISDILENLHFVLMGSFEARKGAWGFFGDLVYMDVGAGNTNTRSFTIGGSPIPGDVQADTHLDMRGTVVTLAATYRVVAAPESHLDLLGGVRMNDVRNRLSWSLSGNVASIALPNRSGEASVEVRNYDAVIGAKGRFHFGADRAWFAPYYVDIGAGDSDLTYQGMIGLGYTFKWGETLVAWRYLGTRFKSGEAFDELNFSGPMVSLVMRW
jgi:hypothetical protein